jgi:hypothetical protein
MSTTTEAAMMSTYEAYGCRVNAVTPEELFRRYADAGFLYPAKRQRLAPNLAEIASNWRRALRGGELLHWVATYEDAERDAWASISSWRSTHRGWQTQHLVSIGGPAGSRAVMLAGQAVRIRDGRDASHQNWFRPDNRFPQRLFGGITRSLGEADAAVIPQVMLTLRLEDAARRERAVPTTAVVAPDDGLVALAARSRGAVYTQAEELDHDDLLLDAVDALYSHVGLRRYRRIWLATAGTTPVGAAIAYRGPLGFNFSFLENRCDLLLDPALPAADAARTAEALAGAAVTAYSDYPLAEIPLVVAERDAEAAARAGATPLRRYTQSIWLRPGFEAMYAHMSRFYERIERVLDRRGLGSAREAAANAG